MAPVWPLIGPGEAPTSLRLSVCLVLASLAIARPMLGQFGALGPGPWKDFWALDSERILVPWALDPRTSKEKPRWAGIWKSYIQTIMFFILTFFVLI